jgi:hypothetical protein
MVDMMAQMDRAEILETLVCEWGQRPTGAPTTADVLPSVLSLQREAGVLVVDFDPGAATTVKAFVEAEQRCCSTIGWDLRTAPDVQLRLTATPAQLDALAQMFTMPTEDDPGA